MESLSRPGETLPSETLYEHLELSHYIDTFRTSAERVRRLLFIVAVFSVVMLTAYWNTTDGSWVNIRRNGYKNLVQLADSQLRMKTKGMFKTQAEMSQRLDEYSRLRTDRVYFPQIPVIGVTFDINDLGNFCGVAYLLLLPLLLFSLIREREHLYLALFKVRRLHDDQRHGRGGESRANYLYHALAMSQVLSSPPTLAQWLPSRLKKVVVPYVLFWFPAILEILVFRSNWMSVDKMMNSFDVTRWILLPQAVLAVFGVAFCYACFRYQIDFNRMWESAFFHINPAYRFVERREPLRIFSWRRGAPSSQWQKRLRSQAISTLEVEPQQDVQVSITKPVFIKDREISNVEIDEMCQQLEREAEQHGTIVNSQVTSSTLNGNRWDVQATFNLRTGAPRRHRQPFALLMFWRRNSPDTAPPDPAPRSGATPAGSSDGPSLIDITPSQAKGDSAGAARRAPEEGNGVTLPRLPSEPPASTGA